jgi:hypothetical protein
MMTRGNPARTIDDEVTSIARRYKVEAVATLIAVCRNEDAPASARATAATTLLAYAEGRPSQSCHAEPGCRARNTAARDGPEH